jgi:hypothetical protein
MSGADGHSLRDIALAFGEYASQGAENAMGEGYMNAALYYRSHGDNLKTPDFHVSVRYLETLKELYRKLTLPDMSELHFRRAGIFAYQRDFNLDADYTLAKPEIKSPLSEDPKGRAKFSDQIYVAQSALSKGVKQFLALQNTKTHIGRRLVDFDSKRAGEKQGYSNNTHEFTPAFYHSATTTATIAQEYRLPSRPVSGRYVLSTWPTHYAVHEYGHGFMHALEDILGNDCLTPFRKACAKDIEILDSMRDRERKFSKLAYAPYMLADTHGYATVLFEDPDYNISSGLKKALSYYLPKTSGGVWDDNVTSKNEAFAELFAGRANHKQIPAKTFMLEKTFQHAARELRNLISAIEFEMASDIDLREILLPSP